MMEQHIDRPIPMPCGFVVWKALNSVSLCSLIDPDAGVLHRDHHIPILIPIGADAKNPRQIARGCHRLHAIHQQIDDHLLQLHPVAHHGGKRGTEFSRSDALWVCTSR